MWRQLLRDSETSVPGPRGKKKGAKKEERRGKEGGKGEGGEDLAEATNPSSLSTKLSFWKKHSDSVNFLLSILPLIPFFGGKRRGPAQGPQDGKPPRMLPGDPGSRIHGGGEAGGGDKPGRQSALPKLQAGIPA